MTGVCPRCAGKISYDEQKNIFECEYCGSVFPRDDSNNNEKIKQIKERANYCFRNCDFDVANSLFQAVIAECNDDAESYWMLVLCEYGVEFVNESINGNIKKIPTCHRANHASILNNENYLNACELSEGYEKESYQKFALIIDKIQKDILAISEKEQPFDVFVCYKESDSQGNQTKESFYARELYHALDKAGYRTFFAPITLQGKAGQDYEPVIFSALNSAKVMFVIAYTAEHYNAVWVRNEWSRFMARKARNPRINLIPCYNSLISGTDILPKEFGNTQMRDLNLASPGDLVATVQRLIPKVSSVVSTAPATDGKIRDLMGAQAAALCKRGFDSLEDGKFKEARALFDDSAKQMPSYSKAYWGMMLADMQIKNNYELILSGRPIVNNNEYKRAVKNGDANEQLEYQQVTAAIEKKMTDVYVALEEKRYRDILDSGIEDLIKESNKKKVDIRAEYDRLIPELRQIESQLKECAAECNDVLAGADKDSSEVGQKIKDYYNDEMKGVKLISDKGYKKAVNGIVQEMKDKLAEIDKAVAEIYDKDPAFVKLRGLIERQKTLLLVLKGKEDELKNLDLRQKNLSGNLDKLIAKYDQAFKMVPNGDYGIAKELLGDIYNAINASLPNIATSGAEIVL